MSDIEYIGANAPDGMVFGKSTTEKIGFYGLATPIVQPSVTVTATTTATTTLLETRCARLEAALVALNLIVTT
jgi:hypothetical protein